ncbi:hypothetical protein [Adlercreutzia muris]|jgi:hypothetical protein|uniref:hypothetical protein n=1 Tax=Adlercreutzia muris TaxID=1796610 RepID=UPI00136525D5|nr:hypothetical protein [Adlercreutzia muris]NCA31672.1 hypothetical protein [Adlercreutzia muris]
MGARASREAVEVASGARGSSLKARVQAAVNDLAAEGKTPSFYQVAQRVGVARSTLYRRADLKAVVVQGRRAAVDGGGAAGRAGPAESCGDVGAYTADDRAERAALEAALEALQKERDALAWRLALRQRLDDRPRFVYAVCRLGDAALIG